MPTTAKPVSYIDQTIASEKFQRQAAENNAYWDRYLRGIDPNPSFSQMLCLEQAIRLLHQGNRP